MHKRWSKSGISECRRTWNSHPPGLFPSRFSFSKCLTLPLVQQASQSFAKGRWAGSRCRHSANNGLNCLRCHSLSRGLPCLINWGNWILRSSLSILSRLMFILKRNALSTRCNLQRDPSGCNTNLCHFGIGSIVRFEIPVNNILRMALVTRQGFGSKYCVWS